MSLSVMEEMVVQVDVPRQPKAVLEGEGVRYEGRIVLVNGQVQRDLGAEVPKDARAEAYVGVLDAMREREYSRQARARSDMD